MINNLFQFYHCECDPNDKQKNVYKIWIIRQTSHETYELLSDCFPYNISEILSDKDNSKDIFKRFLENADNAKNNIGVFEIGKHSSKNTEDELRHIYDILVNRPKEHRDEKLFNFLKKYFDSLKSNNLSSISSEGA